MKGYYKNKNLKSLDRSTLDQGLARQGFHLPVPWQVFSSLQVADAIGVSLQTMHNMKMRRSGPEPEPFAHYRGNRIMYRYDSLCAWITGLPVWKCQQKWLEKNHKLFGRANQTEVTDAIEALIYSKYYTQPQWRRKASAGPVQVTGGVSC